MKITLTTYEGAIDLFLQKSGIEVSPVSKNYVVNEWHGSSRFQISSAMSKAEAYAYALSRTDIGKYFGTPIVTE